MIGVFLGSGGGLSGKVGRKEGGKKEKGRWTITEMRWNQRGFAAKGPPAPEVPEVPAGMPACISWKMKAWA